MRCDLSNEESYDLLSVYTPLNVKFNEPLLRRQAVGFKSLQATWSITEFGHF
jgi:hypothetical protein